MEGHPTASYSPRPPRASTCPERDQGVCCVTTCKVHLCVYRDDHTYQANMDPVLCRMCAHPTREFGKMSTIQLAKQGRGEAAGRQKDIAYISCNSGQKRSVQRAQVTSSISILQPSSRCFENRRNRKLILLRVFLPQQNLEYLELSETS
ncbi:hypothetical protein QR685DRAFT_599722 [Neurospora intermedia]|uniref:Uncharacterized protein n=1 Tax=Neurospora intermedia TaxID=5142 RepID=A0ABR3D747_NEUIN